MIIEIDPNKSAYENASHYFDLAKKFKKKAEKAKEMIDKIEEIKKKEKTQIKKKIKVYGVNKFYYEFETYNGKKILVGRDKKGNMKIVRNMMKENDLYFHADVHGAASVILKDGKKADEKEILEAGVYSACYSSAWKRGLLVCDVFYVDPDQVQKSAPAGEYLAKGAFLITGKKNILKDLELKLVVCVEGDALKIIPGINENLNKGVVIRPYNEKKEKCANQLMKVLKKKYNIEVDFNDLISLLPEGGFKIIQGI